MSRLYNNCIQQTGSDIGFVPLTPLTVYEGPPKMWQSCPDIIQAHKIMKETGLPNFLSCRIPTGSCRIPTGTVKA